MASSWILQALYTSLLASIGGDGATSDQPRPAPVGTALRDEDGTGTRFLASTAYGDLRGFKAKIPTGDDVIQFLGVPFALPPTGTRRFKKPEPPTPWTGVQDALKIKAECLQPDTESYTITPEVPRSEDCLFLQVYVPQMALSSSKPLPVMVWIHGGAYIVGAGSLYHNATLPTKGVILVTLNYRLDVFGFMSSETSVIPGNFGMMDQIFALKWVQQNIAAFGGDPNRVTIFGQSAGSGSVSLLLLSPLSQGLFNRAIMESGVSLSGWAFVHPATRMSSRVVARLIGDQVGCKDFDEQKILACFQAVDSQELLNASISVTKTLGLFMIFSPRVENVFGFLPDLPLRLLARGKFARVDTIVGFNTDEIGQSVIDKEDDGLTRAEFQTTLEESFNQFALVDLPKLLSDVDDMYLGNSSDPKFVRYQTVRALSDLYFNGPTLNELNLKNTVSAPNSNFLYEFNHRPSWSPSPPWVSAIHGQEISYVFGFGTSLASILKEQKPSDDDKAVAEQMMTMWANFAKTGHPTSTIPAGGVKWEPYSSRNKRMLKIQPASVMESSGQTDVVDFYRSFLNRIDTARDPAVDFVG